MIKKLLPVTLFLPVLVLAQAEADGDSSLRSWSVGQLCELRNSAEAWDELERRDVFSKRELRSIEKERIRRGITQDALFCFMGEPDGVIPHLATLGKDLVDGYAYSHEDGKAIVVHVRHREDEPTVVGFITTTADVLQASATIRCIVPPDGDLPGYGCRRGATLYGPPPMRSPTRTWNNGSYGGHRMGGVIWAQDADHIP